MQRLLEPPTRHAAWPALPGRTARRGEGGALHARRDVGRDRGPARRLGDAAQVVLGGIDLGKPPGTIRAEGVRARLPDARRRHRGAVPDVGVLPYGPRSWRALG